MTGFINRASLARKYVSSWLDSNASRGRFMATECILGTVLRLLLLATPLSAACPPATVTLPPRTAISASLPAKSSVPSPSGSITRPALGLSVTPM